MPLHWASSTGKADVVDYLLSLNVPVDARDDVVIHLHTVFHLDNNVPFLSLLYFGYNEFYTLFNHLTKLKSAV